MQAAERRAAEWERVFIDLHTSPPQETAEEAERASARPPPPTDTHEAEALTGLRSINRVDWEALVHPACWVTKAIPLRFQAQWAIAQRRIAAEVAEAFAVVDADPDRFAAAYKWFKGSHVLFLRTTGKRRGRGRRSTDTMGNHFAAFFMEDYDKLVGWFLAAERRAKAQRRRRTRPTRATQLERAIALVCEGQLGKARRLLLSLGVGGPGVTRGRGGPAGGEARASGCGPCRARRPGVGRPAAAA